jgi:hypothetical protein
MRERHHQRLGVLVIAAHYPPSTKAAAIRARNLVRNLQRLGHTVQVVTARDGRPVDTPPEAHAVPWPDIERLAKRLVRSGTARSEVTVRPARRSEKFLKLLAVRLLVPDLRAPWIPAATASARRRAAESQVVLSTGGASAHVVARLVRGGRPWIADINDLWWRNPHNRVGSLRKWVDFRTEAGIIRSATALVVPNDARAGEILDRFGRAATTIPTGFDPAEFEFSDDAPEAARREIVFAGTLYPDFKLALLFDAIAKGRTAHEWSPAMVRVVFIGTGAGRALAEASAWGVDEFVEGAAPIPRPELLTRLMAADVLLLPLYSSDETSLPMRFFDFVGAGRPIIAVGPDARPAARLIRRHALGVVCSSVDDLVSVLDRLVRNPRTPTLPLEARSAFDFSAFRTKLQLVIERATAQRI